MTIKVIDGKAVLSKRDILHDIQENLEYLKESESLSDTHVETLSVLFHEMEILAEIIAVEDKDEDDCYPFLGTSWGYRKKHHQLTTPLQTPEA